MSHEQRKYNEARAEEIVVAIVSPVCPISLLVDDEATPPFCAFEVTNSNPTYTKQGISKWTSNISLYYVHNVEQTATAMKSKIIAALGEYTSSDESIYIENVVESFAGDLFAWKIDFQIIEKF